MLALKAHIQLAIIHKTQLLHGFKHGIITCSFVRKKNTSVPTITQYYADKHIFLTGGSGFCGKPIIEKLLRSCDVGGIYCLIRSKGGLSPNERLQEILKDPLYDSLKKIDPNEKFKKKLHAMDGDIILDQLGLSDPDRELVQEKCSIFIHSAATIGFNDPLKFAADMNIQGSKRLLKLAEKARHTEAVVHLSTTFAYSNRLGMTVEEKVYQPPMDYDLLQELAKKSTDEEMDGVRNTVFKDFANTYTITKSLTEQMIEREFGHLPVSIARLPVIVSPYYEPDPTWMDPETVNAFGLIIVQVGLGNMRIMRGRMTASLDILPVDFCTNAILGIGWHTANLPISSPTIYCLGRRMSEQLTWAQIGRTVCRTYAQHPLKKQRRAPNKTFMTPSRPVFYVRNIVQQFIPAVIGDIIRTIRGEKQVLKKLAGLAYVTSESVYRLTHDGFDNTTVNFQSLINALSIEDKEKFYMDPKAICLDTLVSQYCLAIKKQQFREEIPPFKTTRNNLVETAQNQLAR